MSDATCVDLLLIVTSKIVKCVHGVDLEGLEMFESEIVAVLAFKGLEMMSMAEASDCSPSNTGECNILSYVVSGFEQS